jgi:hypothetical protein
LRGVGSGEVEGRGENKKGRREKKREVEAEEKEGLQHKLIDMQSGCSSIRVHTLAKARTTNTRRLKANVSQENLLPCLETILNCFALEHSAFKTKHLKMS